MAQSIIRAASADIATPFGVKPTIAASLDGALTLLRQFNYELVLIDILFAKADNWALIKEVRSIKQDEFAVPVVVTAPFNSTNMEFDAMKAGANLWLTKPFTAEALSALLAIMCKGR